MKKFKVRKISAIILAIMMIVGMTSNALASWNNYDTGVVHLEEWWYDGRRLCINFYSSGQWVRNVAGEDHTLYINDVPVLKTLYDTGYWCFDKYGNIFAIDTSKRLLLCRAGTTTFQINPSITGCVGFQRDNDKIGYLLYTESGYTYNLIDVLNGTTTGYTVTTDTTSNAPYSYDEIVTQDGELYYYNYKGKQYMYNCFEQTIYCDYNVLSGNIEKFGFGYGYVFYVTNTKPSKVYQLPIGRNTNPKLLGSNFEHFNYDNKGWISSVQFGNNVVNVGSVSTSSNNNYNYYYDYSYGYSYDYPYVEKSGANYYYYTSSNRYYKYYLTGSTLYYKGTNNSNSNVQLATGVKDIVFFYDGNDGYIVYANTSNYVYGYPIGKTGTSYRESFGSRFSYFSKTNYMSEGYYNTSGNYNNFYGNYDEDDYYNYPYVEKSGAHYYYYTDSNRYYKYYLTGSTLYYKGTNNSNSSVQLATGVKDVTFFYDGDDGYIVYATTGNYVYGYPMGKTASSYRESFGSKFSYFSKNNYMSEGYYNTSGNYNDFYGNYNENDYHNYPYVEKSGANYYYYTSSNKYYKYYLTGSTLYYKGTNNSNSSVQLATGVKDITFFYDGDDGYIVYANSGYNVYVYPIGKTTTSFREKIGEDFNNFPKYNYMSDGYYDHYNNFIDFDF